MRPFEALCALVVETQAKLAALNHSLDTLPSVLLIADENIQSDEILSFGNRDQLQVITNRKDVCLTCTQHGIHSTFNDFDFSILEKTYDFIAYRISKERPLVHHIFNSVSKISGETTSFLIIGKKNEGIKGFHKKLTDCLGFSGALMKNGDLYSATLSPPAGKTSIELLDDKNYPTARKIHFKNTEFEAFSKPGQYGWEKIDAGSELLIDEVLNVLSLPNAPQPTSLCDLGCGYGYLGMRLLAEAEKGSNALLKIKHVTATDNNAAAIHCCELNLSEFKDKNKVEIEVVADDCGKTIHRQFDLIVCNPPFHSGFEHTQELSQRFSQALSRLLKSKGSAFVVVNSFIPFEAISKPFFNKVEVITNTGSYKVLQLRHS